MSADSADIDLEIEITPEMIEAGCTEIASYNLDFESREDAVRRIYSEMEKARIAGQRPTRWLDCCNIPSGAG